jgi:hypothetical protein
MEVAERRERERQRRQAECGKCIYRASLEWRGNLLEICKKKRGYGRRCWFFEERP